LLQPLNHLSEVMRVRNQYSNYNVLIAKSKEMINQLNLEQNSIYQKVMAHVYNNISLIIFINGHAGRDKTFLVNVICIVIRSLKKIALSCATTGLAALNYDGGHTVHSLFHILVEHNNDGYKYQINLNSERTKLIQESTIITWDELPMVHKGNIESVDILLCELCNYNAPFSRKIFIGIGDFCQVAPVIPNARRIATILESIKLSTIWNLFETYNLQQPVRDASDPEFSKFMDDVGDGINGEDISLSLLNSTNDLNKAINFIFPINILNNPIFIVSIADDETNQNSHENQNIQRNMITTELLNSFNSSGIPTHHLKLKHGCIATIMRNLSLYDSLCKNTKVVILNIGQQLVTVQNTKTNSLIYLPRITFLF
ncbi:18985_t:CDS:2, partial [Gigaspora margarita]